MITCIPINLTSLFYLETIYNELNLNAEAFIIIKYDKEKRLFYTEKVLDHLSIDEEII